VMDVSPSVSSILLSQIHTVFIRGFLTCHISPKHRDKCDCDGTVHVKYEFPEMLFASLLRLGYTRPVAQKAMGFRCLIGKAWYLSTSIITGRVKCGGMCNLHVQYMSCVQ